MKIAISYFRRASGDKISAAMFLGKSVEVKFYKLAVYEEGGHFDWHMDTTHSDQHHATLLLALNTSWEGGEFKLRRNGVETLVDMHPTAEGPCLQGVAFYADTEHKVEPVTKGIRIVLQYDVEVVGWGEKSVNEKDSDVKDDSGDEYDETELLNYMETVSREYNDYQESSEPLTADNAAITKVTNIIAGLFADGTKEVAFAMQHLYRQRSILPKFLKGADAQLYHALVGSFAITLHPVILHSTTDYEGRSAPYLAVAWDDDSDTSNSDAESDTGSNTSESGGPKVFHLPMLSAIEQVSYKEYIEHTGNEAQLGDMKYFGGGMFVRQKMKEQ